MSLIIQFIYYNYVAYSEQNENKVLDSQCGSFSLSSSLFQTLSAMIDDFKQWCLIMFCVNGF